MPARAALDLLRRTDVERVLTFTILEVDNHSIVLLVADVRLYLALLSHLHSSFLAAIVEHGLGALEVARLVRRHLLLRLVAGLERFCRIVA